MTEAYLVDAVRTPVGRKGGVLADVHPIDLAGAAMTASMARSGVDPAAVEDVVWGCVDAIGPQAGDIARTGWLAAGFPETVPGVTIDRQCGSSLQSVQFAAQGVMSGTQDLVLAGGSQSMSQIPIGSWRRFGQELGFADPYTGSTGWQKRYGAPIDQFTGAEMMAQRWGLDREDLERLALASHQRALAAIDEGRFTAEIAPWNEVDTDEGPRRGTTLEKMAGLAVLRPDGRHTAATASQISDGAAAVLVASERALATHGLTPRARVHTMTVRGADPVEMLSAPIPGTRLALERAGLTIDDIDVFEINEAFAAVVLAWEHELGVDHARVNVNGGAIALGHPIGASGAKLITTLLHELERRQGRYGLVSMCEGGGMANTMIIERL